MTADWQYEKRAREKDFHSICGIDEAGRGPLAGPVVAAAVILPYTIQIDGLDDSKKVSEKRREALFEVICEQAIAWKIAFVEPQTIDKINILNATFLAMQQAVAGLQIPADFALVDGNRSQGLEIPFECVVGGDAKVPSIAAASILAKVARDRYMREIAAVYPQYAFERHKGYGTRAHYAALDQFGLCPIHRMSFLKKYFAKKS